VITGEQNALIGNMETTVAWCVAWCVEDIERDAGKVEALPIGEARELGGNDLAAHITDTGTKESTKLLSGVTRHVDIVRMQIRGHGWPSQAIDATDVVDMAVCHERSHRCEVVFREQHADRFGVGRCIDHDRGTSGMQSDDVGVRFEVPERSRVDEE
jgi:hypothetical protein